MGRGITRIVEAEEARQGARFLVHRPFPTAAPSHVDPFPPLEGGAPPREPVVRYRPFVMNRQREILEAMDDFRSGRMGAIRGS